MPDNCAPTPAHHEPQSEGGQLSRLLARAVLARAILARGAKKAGAAAKTTAGKIAGGHSWGKHQGEFSGIGDVTAFETHIENVMSGSSTEFKDLGGKRSAYYDSTSNTVVIVNEGASDHGTCFKPTAGKAYYDNLV